MPGLLVKLLDDAGAAIDDDREMARACVARAAEILKSRLFESPKVPTDPVVTGGLARRQMNRVLAYMEMHLDGPISARDLASAAELCTSHFFRAFKQSFGVAPMAYIARKRMERARQMMLSSDEPLAQIALACGLCDQAHLAKTFRRLYGVSPNAWRRQQVDPGTAAVARLM